MDNSIARLQEYVLWMNDSLDTDRKRGVWARSATLQTAAHFQKVRELLEWVDMQVVQG